VKSTSESFYQKVYAIVQLIPRGRVSTYGAIGNYLSARSAARMVGYAMNQAHSAQNFIPAHRVVNRNGFLTGKHHFGSPDLMQQLLENEGIEVQNDKIVDFKKKFWDPALEIV